MIKSSEIIRWTQSCRDLALPTWTKRAELGGDGRDMPFEQAFSNLAHAYLRDKAPTLLDHEVGFQLVDRSQDNKKAIGVFGFKVGTQWVYAPVFWLNGDLKGHELLYLKNQDLFVPMKENWLNYITNRKPNILGEGVSRNTSMLGVLSPDLDRLSQSPNKFASANPTLKEMVDAVMPDFAHFATQSPWTDEKYASVRTFPQFLADCSMNTLTWLVKSAAEEPRLGHAIDKIYGLNVVSDAIKAAGAKLQTQRVGSVLNPPSLEARRERVRSGMKAAHSVLQPDPRKHPIKTGALKIVTH